MGAFKGDLMRRIARVTAMAVIAAGLTVGGATAANAVNCPSGYTCLWGDRNYLTNGIDNRYFKFSSKYTNLKGALYEGQNNRTVNDDVSSVYNNGTSQNSAVYVNANCMGSALVINRGSGFSELNTQAAAFNDQISSGKFISGSSATQGC